MAITLTEFRAQFNAPLREGLIEIIDNSSKVLPLMHFIPTDDFKYEWTKRTALPTVTTRAIGGEYTETNGTPVRVSEPLAIMGGMIKVDNQIWNKKGGETLRREAEGMSRSAGLFFDQLFFDGDIAGTATQFDGLNVRLTGNQVISAGTNGAAVTLTMIDDLVAAVRGNDSGKTLLMNRKNRLRIKQLQVAAGTNVTIAELGGAAGSYGGVPIIEIEEGQTNNAILGFDETQGSSTVTSSIYCVRFGRMTDDEDVQGLIGSEFMNVSYQGLRGTQHYSVLDANLGIAQFHPEAAARLKGVLAA
ncbi:MAG TPA: phage major capsid protein [Tepidisphaeraceae bacterium]|jgi:hypothetical protein